MPDLRSINPPFLTATQPSAKSSDGPKSLIIRYYPGRDVSVQFGLPPPDTNTTADGCARIILLFGIAGVGDGVFPTPRCDTPLAQLQVPGVIVLAAGEPNISKTFTTEQTVTLFVEPRFVRETSSSDVTGVKGCALTELSGKDELIGPLADIFCKLSQREQRPNSQYVDALGIVMATRVLHYFFGGEAPADRRGGLPTEAWHRVVAYIDGHYADEFDLDALARVSGYSRNHFQRLFKKSFGQTPRDYIRACQVQHAITQLQTTNLKGLDVALACGFCDETQMARWFVKLRGCLPGQVREAARW